MTLILFFLKGIIVAIRHFPSLFLTMTRRARYQRQYGCLQPIGLHNNWSFHCLFIEYIVPIPSILRFGQASCHQDFRRLKKDCHLSSRTVIILKCGPSSCTFDMIVEKGEFSVVYVSVEASLKGNAICNLAWPVRTRA